MHENVRRRAGIAGRSHARMEEEEKEERREKKTDRIPEKKKTSRQEVHFKFQNSTFKIENGKGEKK